MKTQILIVLLSLLISTSSCSNSRPENNISSMNGSGFKPTQAAVLTTFKTEFNGQIWKDFLYEGTTPDNYYWDGDCLMLKDGVLSESPTMSGIVLCKTPELFSNAQSFLGDIDSDGLTDALVVFTIEGFNGGDNSITFYSVLLNNNEKLIYKCTIQEPAEIGFDELVEIKEIKDGIIVGKKYQVDASSKTELGAIKWVYENGALNKL